MRQWRPFKLCATLLALWLPMVVGEAAPVAYCQQHHATLPGAANAPAAHHHGAQQTQQKDETGPCSCIDGGTLRTAMSAVPARPYVLVGAATFWFDPPSPRWLPAMSADPALVYDATGPPAQVV
jgi:hypothetical protein